jgi:hypothetical protein
MKTSYDIIPTKSKSEVRRMKKIIEYLGIEEELVDDPINQEAIQEAKQVRKKYQNEISSGELFYAFHADVPRFSNPGEKTEIVEQLKHITVFKLA